MYKSDSSVYSSITYRRPTKTLSPKRATHNNTTAMTTFESPLAKHLNPGANTVGSQHDSAARAGSEGRATAVVRSTAAARPTFSGTPASLLRSRLSPQPAQLRTQPRHRQATTAEATLTPVPPTATLDEVLGRDFDGFHSRGTAPVPQEAPLDTGVSTPRRPLARPQPATPTLFATTAPQGPQLAMAVTHQQQQQAAAARQQPALWTPLVASTPSLPAGKAQGAGLLSVRKSGPLQAATGASPAQQTSTWGVAAGTPACPPGGATPSGQQQQHDSEPATGHRQAAHAGLREQQLGSQARLLFTQQAAPPEAPGGVAGAAGLVEAAAGSVGSWAAAGGGPGLQQLQHLAGSRFSALTVRLHAAEDPAVLRRELRSLLPELPVAPYVPPALGTQPDRALPSGEQQQQQQPHAMQRGQQANRASLSAALRPALLEGGAAVGAALDRLEALQREGQRLADEGAGMDRCRAFASQARPLLEAASATPAAGPAGTLGTTSFRHLGGCPASGTAAATPPAAARAAAERPAAEMEAGRRGRWQEQGGAGVQGGPDEPTLRRLQQLRQLQREGALLAARLAAA